MGIFSGFCLFGPLKNSNGANAGPECGFLSPKMLMGCLLDDACEVWGDDSKKIFNPWGLAQVTQAPTHLPFQFWALAMPGHSLGSALGGPPQCSGARTGLGALKIGCPHGLAAWWHQNGKLIACVTLCGPLAPCAPHSDPNGPTGNCTSGH